jgi:hypothetical protein
MVIFSCSFMCLVFLWNLSHLNCIMAFNIPGRLLTPKFLSPKEFFPKDSTLISSHLSHISIWVFSRCNNSIRTEMTLYLSFIALLFFVTFSCYLHAPSLLQFLRFCLPIFLKSGSISVCLPSKEIQNSHFLPHELLTPL